MDDKRVEVEAAVASTLPVAMLLGRDTPDLGTLLGQVMEDLKMMSQLLWRWFGTARKKGNQLMKKKFFINNNLVYRNWTQTKCGEAGQRMKQTSSWFYRVNGQRMFLEWLTAYLWKATWGRRLWRLNFTQRFCWRSIICDMTEYCKTCDIRRQHLRGATGHHWTHFPLWLDPFPIMTGPFQWIAMDFVEPLWRRSQGISTS